jgi:hypothetical protein
LFLKYLLVPTKSRRAKHNVGYIQLGNSHDTSEFACDSFRHWWCNHARLHYPSATSILVLCDGGGSNSSRHYLFKQDLQSLADELERKSFKNVHWLLRQRRADLNADERRMLNRLFRYSPKLQEAYEACESLTAIYESRLSKGQGKRKLRGWMERVTNRKLSCFDSFLGRPCS